ncbi:membrane Transport [Methylobacterium phyllosphaerae]|uniref:Membrane Transport n=1 Tax=Methylobacterium phyllosphaerae TaxID=418223 RepID=A0AAE8L5M0_9HYPH|nr:MULTISPECIES: hypothetical protein [Methylobacterium]APT33430.1 membrane Transport [Methylobacterium phyllosphaerae]SFG60154.1 minor curlin subunit [Methylobacterium phyllosphaerae]
MMRRTRRSRTAGQVLLFVLPLMAGSAAAQDRVAIEQIQALAQRAAAGAPGRAIQESDYILGNQSGILLLSPSLPPQPAANQAQALQVGTGNISTIDMSGYGNVAVQSIIGARNTVTQQQTGSYNQSTVSVFGDSNTVGTRQDGSGAAATITVRGDNNAISAQQQGNNALPISITQVGNGANVSVTRR